jgi:hypothetical protein
MQPSAAQVRAFPKLRTSGSEPGARRLPFCNTAMVRAFPSQTNPNQARPAARVGRWLQANRAALVTAEAARGRVPYGLS